MSLYCLRCKRHVDQLVITDYSNWALCEECVDEIAGIGTPCVDTTGEETHEWVDHTDVLTGDLFALCARCGEQTDLLEAIDE